MIRYRLPPLEPYAPGNRKITAARLAQVKRLREQGKTFAMIADKMQLSRETVRQWIRSAKK